MTPGSRFSLLVAALLLIAPLVPAVGAQEDSEPAPLALGDFTLSGSTTAGFRFTDVKGYRPQFREMFDLGDGFRLLDLGLNGDAQEGANSFADHFSLQLSSLGGDPFPTAQFAISKHKVYDLRVDWRQSYYFWNQNNNVVLPIAHLVSGYAALPANDRTGLTNNHDWDTVRKFGSVDLTLYATNHLRFRFNYYRPSDEGTTFTTRSGDFFGSPGFWGTFARANPVYLDAPIADYTNRFTGGVDYSVKNWNFHYNIGYQTFTENSSLNNVGSPQHSINPVTILANPLANTIASYSATESRRLTTPISEFSFVGKPLAKLEWRGGYTYYRYQGPMAFDQAFNGTAPSAAGPQAPFVVSQTGRAMVIEPNNVITQGLTYHLFEWWSLDADYKYSRFTTDSNGSFASLFNGANTAGITDTVWRDGLSDLAFRMDFNPMKSLVIRTGVQLMKSDVESLTNGVVDKGTTLQTKTVRPEISFGYEPSKLFSVRGDFHTVDNGASYTAFTPHTQQGMHFMVRVHPTDRISIEDEVSFADSKFLTVNFQNNVRSNATTVSYSLSDLLSVFGGFSFDSYYAQGDIEYLRGTGPLNDFLRDQELNRVWSGGIEIKPVKRAGLRLSGNFDRSSGVGLISGTVTAPGQVGTEPPAYGPLTWPLVTGTGYYNFPVAGQLAVDLQRTYYDEMIVKANNFGSSLLTIRWTKSF